ncbi:type II toxin-antitoxin system VapC family toxin [Agrococcus baldri]|uniref:Ribonuclease VapC n=1 Tax=Agrococcus baldri TaxID=153730 RepID=A0AA87RIW1_9MICO|nr:type II toxin-antitoxin system VapC family toxin [Agrococcus baldri]GEK80123.1 ribonuclease VapC [Agrococcus baldri]
MIVIDTSALVAIVAAESDAERVAAVLLRHAGDVELSAATLLEATIVLEARYGADASTDLELLIDRLGIAVVPVDADQAAIAAQAWRRFGKGRHPAALNFGDCFSYALATARGAALLFKGRDFAQTDVRDASG